MLQGVCDFSDVIVGPVPRGGRWPDPTVANVRTENLELSDVSESGRVRVIPGIRGAHRVPDPAVGNVDGRTRDAEIRQLQSMDPTLFGWFINCWALQYHSLFKKYYIHRSVWYLSGIILKPIMNIHHYVYEYLWIFIIILLVRWCWGLFWCPSWIFIIMSMNILIIYEYS